MKTIQLQFSTTKTIASRLIRWRDWSNYSHVDFVMPDGRLLGALPNGGVQIRDDHPVINKLILSIYVTDSQYEDIVSALVSQINKPYDYAGVVGLVFNRDWEEEDKWFCSEFIMYGFKHGGINLLRTNNLSRISPKDILLSPLLN